MRNVKGYAVANDGDMKRIAITFDEIDDSGKVVSSNIKINRVVTDEECTKHLDAINEFVKAIVDSEE